MHNYFLRDMVSQSIITFASGDVNGDKVPDNVYLTGIRTPGIQFIQNVTLIIQDGMTGITTSVPLKENAGYNPTLFLGDFSGDGVDDILVGMATGGSGGTMIYYIFSFKNNMLQLLFDIDAYNEQYQYSVTFLDNYKVEVVSKINSTRYIIDISYKGSEYLDEIYEKDGRLKNPITGFVNPLSGMYPVDFDSNGVYELLAYQKIAGRYNADSLGYVQNMLKLQNGKFVLFNQEVSVFGSEMKG